MAATEATAALNAMAGSSPGVASKKRQRTPEQEKGYADSVTERAKSRTRRAGHDATASEQRTSSRSQEQGLTLTEAEAEPDGGDATYSPTGSKREVTKKHAPRATKRKPSRRLNQKKSEATTTEASPFRGHAFDSIDPVQNSKAQLTSFNSPAKSTRSRSKRGDANPLLSLEDHSILFKSRAQDGHRETHKTTVEQQDSENGHEVSHSSTVKRSRKASIPQEPQPESEPGQEVLSDAGKHGPADDGGSAAEDTVNGGHGEQVSSAPKTQTQTQRQKNRKTKSKDNGKRSSQHSDEDLQAATKKVENLNELARAEEEEFDARSARYMEDISDLATDMDLYETWATVGGAALTIRSLVRKKKAFKSTPTDSAMKQILLVTGMYKTLNSEPQTRQKDEVSSAEKILQNVQLLRDRAESSFLKRENQSQGDESSAVKDLYEQLIPSHVWLLREALQATYGCKKGLSKASNKEMLKLTKAGLNFCDIATGWQPNSSNVESGVRKMVRNLIRPNLFKLYSYFLRNDTRMAQQEWEDRQNRQLAARQAKSRRLMRKETSSVSDSRSVTSNKQQKVQLSDRTRDARALQELDVQYIQRLDARHAEGRPETESPPLLKLLPSPPRMREQQILLELGGLELGPLKKQHSPERQERLPTEEIPAPDPCVQWTKTENVALLNGLQEFLNGDRYTRIIEKYSQLGGKDMDQIVAQAQFFKRMSERDIQTLESQGDHSLSWLSTVTL